MPEYKTLYIKDLNPEPWTSGTAALGYKGRNKPYPKISKDQRLADYQEGVRSCVQEAYPGLEMFPEGIELHLICKFWRQLDSYTGEKGRTQHRNVADATNMTKAVEDALQGVLYKNDRQVKHSEGEIMMEGPDIHPRIMILCAERVREVHWQEMANNFEAAPVPSPPGNVFYTRYML
jgi:Holliday junction resolvase RusA-like endonuclease